jgi:hypothetical protein
VVNGLTLISSTDKGIAVWHVSVAVGQSAALTGAWLRESSAGMESLTFDRVVLEGRDVVGQALKELAAELLETQGQLDQAFHEWRAKQRTNVIRPRWAKAPDGPNFEGPEAIGTPMHMIEPLAFARWAQALLTAWADTETQRMTRPFLVTEDAPAARMFPPRWLAAWAPGAPA